MVKETILLPGALVWVPRKAISIYSRPGHALSKGLWDVGIITKSDEDGNLEVLVNGCKEFIHTNFIRPLGN